MPTNPEQINFTQETLGLRRAGFSPALSLLMPTESFPIAPTALTVPLHSYGMLAYQLETSGLRSRREIAVLAKDGDLLRFLSNRISKLKFEIRDLTVEISESETSVCGLSPVILSAQGCLTSELLRFL